VPVNPATAVYVRVFLLLSASTKADLSEGNVPVFEALFAAIGPKETEK
jgi:hypothetical protein